MTERSTGRVNETGLAKPVVAVAVSSILIKSISVINNVVIANKFGASKQLDTFLAVQSIVDFTVAFFTITIGVVFIPTYIGLLKINLWREAQELVNSLFTLLLVISALVTSIYIVTSNTLLDSLFKFDPEVNGLPTTLFFLSVFSIVPLVLSSLFTNILNSYKQFVFPSSLGVIVAVIPVLSVILLAPSMHIFSMSLGVIVTSWFTFIALYYFLVKQGFRLSLKFDFRNSNFVAMIKTSILLLLPSAAVQLNQLIDRMFASQLNAGSISALYFSRAIRDLPLFIVMSFSVVILPYFSEKAQLKNESELSNLLSKSLRVGSFILIPTLIAVSVLSSRIIGVLYQGQLFGQTEKRLIIELLNILLYGAAPYWFITVITSVFYAKRKFVTVATMGVFAICFNFVMDFILSNLYLIKGLALSTTLLEIIFFVAYVLLTKRLIKSLDITELIKSIAKILFTSLILRVFLLQLNSIDFLSYSSSGVILEGIKLVIILFLGATVYTLLSFTFKVKELFLFVSRLSKLTRQHE